MKKAIIIILIQFLFCMTGFSRDFTGSWVTGSQNSYGKLIDEPFTFYEDGTGKYFMDNGSMYSSFTYTYIKVAIYC